MNKLFSRILSLIYPNRCISCGRVQRENSLCAACKAGVEINPYSACPRCGGNRGACDCKATDFAFDGISAPFVYTGTVRQGLMNFKFYRRPDAAAYFARAMADRLRRDTGGIHFDAVAFVPMTDAGRRARGYNQAELLAGQLAELLDLPLMTDALVQVRATAVQHKLGRRARFENVRGAYAAAKDVRGKHLLLVDDIRTTGATLHECAHMLRASGAASVFCTVAAIRPYK